MHPAFQNIFLCSPFCIHLCWFPVEGRRFHDVVFHKQLAFRNFDFRVFYFARVILSLTCGSVIGWFAWWVGEELGCGWVVGGCVGGRRHTCVHPSPSAPSPHLTSRRVCLRPSTKAAPSPLRMSAPRRGANILSPRL